jgi:hypothetical protein
MSCFLKLPQLFKATYLMPCKVQWVAVPNAAHAAAATNEITGLKATLLQGE